MCSRNHVYPGTLHALLFWCAFMDRATSLPHLGQAFFGSFVPHWGNMALRVSSTLLLSSSGNWEWSALMCWNNRFFCPPWYFLLHTGHMMSFLFRHFFKRLGCTGSMSTFALSSLFTVLPSSSSLFGGWQSSSTVPAYSCNAKVNRLKSLFSSVFLFQWDIHRKVEPYKKINSALLISNAQTLTNASFHKWGKTMHLQKCAWDFVLGIFWCKYAASISGEKVLIMVERSACTWPTLKIKMSYNEIWNSILTHWRGKKFTILTYKYILDTQSHMESNILTQNW